MNTSSNDLLNMHSCRLCPRNCGADRTGGRTGFCREPEALYLSRAALMEYEEPCISVGKGSGAVFFNGCNLGCIFCQNTDISKGMEGPVMGKEISAEELSSVFLSLQDKEAANINLVTPSHYLHKIVPALRLAREKGLRIPVVYNTSSYEKPESLKLLEGLVDIYIPDMKFYSSDLSARWAKAPDYYDRALEAIDEMVRQCPKPLFDNGMSSIEIYDETRDETCNGINEMEEVPENGEAARQGDNGESSEARDEAPAMLRGVIIRHLVMPGQIKDSKEILRRLYDRYGNNVFFSIMSQYTPMPGMTDPFLQRKVSEEEYEEVVDFAISIGIENGFIQEGDTVSQSFIPKWDLEGL